MLERIRERLLCEPRDAPGDADAAVLIAVTAEREPQIILTVRAAHMRSHPGEVAFPGGRRDAADRGLVDTALRESHEEIGLDPRCVEILAAGRQRTSRFGVRVYPFVGVVPADVRLSANRGGARGGVPRAARVFPAAREPAHGAYRRRGARDWTWRGIRGASARSGA